MLPENGQTIGQKLAAVCPEDLLYLEKGIVIFIILPTPGCAYVLSESGGESNIP